MRNPAIVAANKRATRRIRFEAKQQRQVLSLQLMWEAIDEQTERVFAEFGYEPTRGELRSCRMLSVDQIREELEERCRVDEPEDDRDEGEYERDDWDWNHQAIGSYEINGPDPVYPEY